MRIMLILVLLALFPGNALGNPGGIPLGYTGLCRTSPHLCAADQSTTEASEPKAYTEEVLNTLQEVNTYWNEKITAVTDVELYQERELWVGATDRGDCEEFAIAKKMSLLEHGFTASQLLYAIVKQENGEIHLVLFVRTTAGILVLDNLNPNIVTFEESGYTLHSHQRPEQPKLWQANLVTTVQNPTASVR